VGDAEGGAWGDIGPLNRIRPCSATIKMRTRRNRPARRKKIDGIDDAAGEAAGGGGVGRPGAGGDY